MDFMSQYASDNEEDDQEVLKNFPSSSSAESKSIQPIVNTTTQQPTVSKKKKLLDISFLPNEIQDLLTRGDNGDDSDEDIQPKHQKPFPKSIPAKTSKVPTSKTQSIDPLLRSLPPPKNTDPFDSAYTKPATSNTTTKATTRTTTLQQINAKRDVATLYSDNNYEESHEYEDEEEYAGKFVSTSYEQPIARDDDEKEIVQPANANKKRRERQIEHMLMSGDTSVLEQSQVREVSAAANHSWDALKYTDQQQKEAMIMKSYTSDGNIKSVVQPTRLQNHRHQLSSLALKAAETEIAMLDARGARTKSKSQTQSRYGW